MKESITLNQVGNKRCLPLLKIMKITILLCFTCVFSLFAETSFSQETSMSMSYRNITISQLFSKIESETDYVFLLSDDVSSSLNKSVSVNVESEDIEAVLNQVLEGSDMSYLVVGRQVTVYKDEEKAAASAGLHVTELVQQDAIKGRVVDSQNTPLIGVSVTVVGSTSGTITDIDGNFSISVDPNATLRFSYLGFEPVTVKIDGRKKIDVTLQESLSTLEEVVVVGYGVQKKVHVTGAVEQVTSEKLLSAPMPSVTNMLAGKLPGLVTRQSSGLPGDDQTSMVIRGMGTFNDASPLLLVDGVERNFNTLDPNDVESVTILKDGAAAAVYGMKAANGVILVTTKRGKAGEKPKITYSGSYTFATNTKFPEFLNAPDYARWHNKAREMDGYTGYYSSEDIDKMINGDPDGILGNTDWVGDLFKSYGGTQQHNISVAGGSEKVQFFVSGGLMDQEGIIPNTNFKRYNLRSNVDVQITNELKLSLDIAGRKEDKLHPGFAVDPNNGYNPITQAIRALPVMPKEYNGLPTATGEGSQTWNPLAAANDSGFNKRDRSIFESSATLEYNVPFVDGLKVKMFFNYDRNFTEQRTFLDRYDVAKFNPATKTYTTTQADGTGKSSLWQSSSNGSLMMARPSIEYNKTLGGHNFGALFLYEYTETGGSSFQASKRDFILNALTELPFGQEVVPGSVAGSSTETRVAGYVGRLNYSYQNKYLVEASFRYDGSYRFHKDYRWGFFPGVSLGWVISEENFIKDKFTNLDYLKVRASFAELGNDGVVPFMYKRTFDLREIDYRTGDGSNVPIEPQYAFGTNPLAGYGFYSLNSVPSFDLTWETSRTFNFGAEMTAFRGKLSASLDVFYKYTHNILQDVKGLYPPSISDQYATRNNDGKVDVRGIELSLGHLNTVGEVTYSLNGNVSWARSKLLERSESENIPSWQTKIGQPIGVVYGFHALGLYQTEEQLNNRPTGPGGVQRLGDLMYEDYNNDGRIDYEDQVRIARSQTPEMIFSLSGNAKWKNFDASFQLQGAALCDVITSGLYPNGIMDQTEFARPFYAGGNSPYYLVEGSWTPENTDAKYPRLGVDWNGNNGWTSDWWVKNGAYLRLKNAQIGYTLPKHITDKFRADRLRVYVAGTNLFTIDALDYMDPEMPSNNNGYYPQQRTYSIGIDLTF